MTLRIHHENGEFRVEEPIKSDAHLAVTEISSCTAEAGVGRFWARDPDHQPMFTPSDGSGDIVLGGGSAGPRNVIVGLFNCDSGLAVGDLVQITADDTVDYASQSGTNIGVAAGIVALKPSLTSCYAAFYGEVGDLTGIVAGQVYWLGVDGVLDTSPPTDPDTISQMVGIGKNTTTLVFIPGTVSYL